MESGTKFRGYIINPNQLFLRTSHNGVSYNEFKRKKMGVWNKAEKWSGISDCSKCGGFFGMDREFNGFGLMGRPTIEMCEWRGERVSIDYDKICVSEYRVLAINEDIPDWLFEECGYNVLRKGDFVKEIKDGSWIIFGGEIGEISGGFQNFHGCSSAGNAEIAGGHQDFRHNSSAGKAIISGGNQYFYDKSSAGNARISGGHQRFYGNSSAGKVKISGGFQNFRGCSSAGNTKMSGGYQRFYGNSSAGNAIITGGYQDFYGDSSAGNAIITDGDQLFYNNSSAGDAEISGGSQDFYGKSSAKQRKRFDT